MPTVNLTAEPEIVVADAAAALQPTIAAVLAKRGPHAALAVLLVLQDWVSGVAGDVHTDKDIAAWLDEMYDGTADLSDKAHMVLKLRAVDAAGTA